MAIEDYLAPCSICNAVPYRISLREGFVYVCCHNCCSVGPLVKASEPHAKLKAAKKWNLHNQGVLVKR